MADPEPQDEREEAYDFRRFILRSAIAYGLAHTPPIASIFKDIPNPDDHEDGISDWELELSRQAQLRRGIDLKHIVNRFVESLASAHGERRAERFIEWVLDGNVSRFAYVKRGEIYSDRCDLIGMIRAGGYRRGEFD